jgi:hypothetical protein
MSVDTNGTPWMPTNATQDSFSGDSSSSDDTDYVKVSFVDQKFGVMVFLGVVIVLVLIVLVVREYCRKKYGVDIFAQSLNGSRNQLQQEGDRALAEELQRRVNDEEREKERITKCDERRVWYEHYIKDFTMVRTVEIMASFQGATIV